jgi:hypothetical protein
LGDSGSKGLFDIWNSTLSNLEQILGTNANRDVMPVKARKIPMIAKQRLAQRMEMFNHLLP